MDWYLQPVKQQLKQHIKDTVFNVPKSAEDTGFTVLLFSHVFLCVVSARKQQQGQNSSFSKERERSPGVSKPSSAVRGTFFCPVWNLPSTTLLSIACRGRSKAFSFGALPKIPAVVDICNQYSLVVCVLLALLLKVFKSILVAGGEVARGEVNQCVRCAARPALLPGVVLPHLFRKADSSFDRRCDSSSPTAALMSLARSWPL